LSKIVDAVYKALENDREMNALFSRFKIEALKERLTDYLRGEWGGKPYTGPDLFIAHAHLGITSRQFDCMMKHFAEALQRFNVRRQETAEVFDSLTRMRFAIVDVDLRFRKLYMQHAAALAARTRMLSQGRVEAGGAQGMPAPFVPNPTALARQSLYLRMGGEPMLRRLVTKVHDAMEKAPEFSKFFANFRSPWSQPLSTRRARRATRA